MRLRGISLEDPEIRKKIREEILERMDSHQCVTAILMAAKVNLTDELVQIISEIHTGNAEEAKKIAEHILLSGYYKT